MGFKNINSQNRRVAISEDDPRLMNNMPVTSILKEECRVPFTDPRDLRPILDSIDSSLFSIANLQQQMIDIMIQINSAVSYEAPPIGPVYSTGQIGINVATPNKPDDPDVIAVLPATPGYDQHKIYDAINRIAKKVSMINDGADTLYVIASTDGKTWSADEIDILTGEAREFYDVYELRVRCAAADNLYRVTEYQYSLAYATFVTPNRDAYIASERNIGLAAQQLTAVVVPNGYGLVVRADPNNTADVYIATSAVRVVAAATRGTLSPGDHVKMYITNADLLWTAAQVAGQNLDIYVEQ